MAELAGFPEVAVLSLLFHLNGGMLDIVAKQEEICEQKIGEEIIFAVDGMDRFKLNCGCGLSKCGASDWCYIPPQVHCSSALDQLENSSSSGRILCGRPSRGGYEGYAKEKSNSDRPKDTIVHSSIAEVLEQT
eukprot:scaffold2463_cov261-Chaetoceros_neogracile.AAC.2